MIAGTVAGDTDVYKCVSTKFSLRLSRWGAMLLTIG